MATAAKITPQDLPPKGGYGSIVTERTKLRTFISGRTAILTYAAVTSVGFYIYFLNFKMYKRHEVEMRSAQLAMWPVLLAERDREYMKQLNRNRKDEAELMKNVPGWEVGTWFGKPIYKTISSDKFIDPLFHEYYIHADGKDSDRRAYMALLT